MRWMVLIPVLWFLPSLQAQAPGKTVNELKAFFAANCVKCHGTDGSALGTDGKKLVISRAEAGVSFIHARIEPLEGSSNTSLRS